MAVAQYLVDTSALARMRYDSVAARLEPLLDRGLVATCAVLNLEALFSAESPTDHAQLTEWRSAIMEYVDTEEAHLRRAQEVQARLAAKSMHRAVKLPDLIVSAVAEGHRLTVIHYDADFEYVSEVTGQTVEWVVPRGSVN